MNETASNRNGETPIESWKEIGAYLQRDATTARRWEKEEALPVHRHNHKSRSSVYAYASEIDAWRASRKIVAEPPPPVPLWRSLFARPRALAFGVTMLACLIMVGNGIRPASAQQVRGSGTLAKRLLCSGCGSFEADFSRDGRWMVFPDWDSGDIAIRDMSTEKVKRLLAKTGAFTGSSDFYGHEVYAELPILSPDLRQVVYLWETGGKDDHDQLRLMQNEPAAKPRVLIDNPEISDYQPIGWFPDNKSVLVALLKADKTWQFARVSVSDGSVRSLKSLEWRRPSYTSGLAQSISPDGKYVVYSALAVNPSKSTPAPTDPKDQHLYILAVDGSGETEIVKAAGINSNPVWTPDGKHILFTSDRSGNVDLWSIAVQNGKAAGAESLVSPGIGNITALGMHSGSYYYEPRRAPTYYVSIAEMKPTGEKTQDAVRTAESFVGQSPSWSPDGKSIALKRPHPGGSGGDYDVVVHSLETGAERAYLTSLGTTGNGAAIWSHDGKSVATGIHGTGRANAHYRIDLKTGDFKELPGAGGSFALSPDDKTMYVVPNLTQNLLSVDLSTGQQRQIFILPGAVGRMKLSPDGRTLAIIQNDSKNPRQRRIACIAVDGSDYREVFVAPPSPGGLIVQGNLGWTNDSRGILFDMHTAEGDPYRIMRVPAEGGTPESTGFEVKNRSQGFELSPDGSRIALSNTKQVSDLWAIDNVLSAVK